MHLEAASDMTGRGWLARARTGVQTTLFGYDFFISYRTADGVTCARSLQAALHRRGFDCFLDVQHYEAGHNLPWMQSQALKRSTKLLVIVTPRAHVSPPTGTDWLLAEVLEFKHLASRRRSSPGIVPLGTPNTLSAAQFPGSKLLPEIPTPAAGHICIFDEAAERNSEIAPQTVEKLVTDFREVRRRRWRHAVGLFAVLAVASAVTFSAISAGRAAKARYTTRMGEAFRLLDRGREGMDAKGGVESARAYYARSLQELRALGRDPLIALHHQFAAGLRELRATKIAEVGREVGYLKLSADGNWALIVHDYQAPNGSPDIERIPKNTAFAVFHFPTKRWTLRRTVGTAIGTEIYEGADVVAFEAPAHVIVRTPAREAEGKESFWRVSLEDGAKTELKTPPATPPPARVIARPDAAKARLEQLLARDRLFKVDPKDGIDLEYGARMVPQTYVEAPDGRTAIVGTYEGRLMLVDLVTGLSRGEMETDTIYAAAYRPDGSRAYFCDKRHLWEVDVSGSPGIQEMAVTLRRSAENAFSNEKVLSATWSDDTAVLGLATNQRLLCFVRETGTWREWPLPRTIEKAAAFRVDTRRSRLDFIAADDGTIASADYATASAPLEILPRPGGAKATVAWLDAAAPSVWLADAKSADGRALIQAVPLPDQRAQPITLPAKLRSDVPFHSEERLVLHAMARLDRTVLLFHGDEESADDRREVLDEQMLRLPLDASASAPSRVLFRTTRHDNGPDYLWTCTQIAAVIPGSRASRLFVRTQGEQTYELGLDGGLIERAGGLCVRTHEDGDQSYLIEIGAGADDAWLAIRHEGTGTALRYQLPWPHLHPPKFGVIATGGRQALLASEWGEFLLFDVTGLPNSTKANTNTN